MQGTSRCGIFACATLAFAALGACSSGPPSSGDAIRAFVAAEDGGFASQRGAFRIAAGGLNYYESSLALPGASNCAIYTTASGSYAFGTCDFLAASRAEALRTYGVWKRNTIQAEPGWRFGEPNPPLDRHLATFQAADASNHAIYLYVADVKGAPGTYRVTETFGTVQGFGSK
jgi:hypothetical protein